MPPLEAVLAEIRLREARRNADEIRASQARPGGLIEFIRYFWQVLEPATPFVDGWPLEAICAHLEAVTFGQITRLLENVPPGFMKSLTTLVFWEAWEWGPMNMPHLRYVTFSYSAMLTERDNGRFRDLILSPEYQILWGDRFNLRKIGEQRVSNDHTGWKLATSVGGVGTGERGDRVILDDPHNVKESESDLVRSETVRWFRESMSNRLNNMEKSAVIVIMQRVHGVDVSGVIIEEKMAYDHLMIPMEYDPGRHCTTAIGWSDPRKYDGELAWPARFSREAVAQLQRDLGPYAYAGQYQQAPVPRGGGIIKRDMWQMFGGEKYPDFEYVLASLDTAYTTKQENDPSALTVWGFWRENGRPRVVLVHAWRKWLEMHGKKVLREPGETEAAYQKRSQPSWGLVEWVIHSCRRWKADRLLIEAKAAGITAAQEIRRELFATETWGVDLVDPKGDKVARTHSVQPIWANGIVYAPNQTWADMVLDEVEAFPKGTRDDLHDTCTQAMKHLRDIGLLTFAIEDQAVIEENLQFRPVPKPLYNV